MAARLGPSPCRRDYRDGALGASAATRLAVRGRRALTLLQDHDAIGGAAREGPPRAAGPLHLDPLVRGVVGQAEVQARVVLREVAGAGLDLTGEPALADEDVRPRAHGVADARGAGQAVDEEPVLTGPVVLQQAGAGAQVR